MFIKLDINAIHSELGVKLGARNFLVISTIASYMNEQGNAFSSQDKIAELSGYSRQTINKTIRELKEIKINGSPVLKITQRKTKNGIANNYQISKDVGFSFGRIVKNSTGGCKESDPTVSQNESNLVNAALQEQELENKNYITRSKEQELVFDNAKQVVDYFQQKYFETYNVAYNPNWGRDSSMIKSKLLSKFTGSDIKTMVDVAFRDYDKRWKSSKYPRVTLGQISTWLGNKALTIVEEESKKQKKTAIDSDKYRMDEDQFRKVDEYI